MGTSGTLAPALRKIFIFINWSKKLLHFYKPWNIKEYETHKGAVNGNRKYGLAKAEKPEGPYRKVSENPVIDFADMPDNERLEDAFVWKQ